MLLTQLRGRLRQSRSGFSPALRRVDLLPNSVQLWVDGVTITQLQHRLVAGEDDHIDPATNVMVVISPVRLKLRGGRTWIEGVVPVAKAERKPDEGLVDGLRKAHRTVRDLGLFGPRALATRSPPSQYERRRTRLAFLAPDLQRARLAGDQPLASASTPWSAATSHSPGLISEGCSRL